MKLNTESQILAFYQFHAWPLIKYLYQAAGLEVPERLDHTVEGPRLVAALEAKGFDLKFRTITGEDLT